MSILIINRMSQRTAAYHKWLHGLKEPLVMICDETRRGQIEEGYDEVHFLANWRANGNLERIAAELHERYQFRVILNYSESDMERVARLRERLGVPGQTLESATAFRNKVRMKEILKQGGVRVPEFREVLHPLDLVEFCEQHGFPAVYKPIDGAGSEQTYILRDWVEVHEALETTAFRPFEVETFVEGEMHHVDGVRIGQETPFITASKYLNDCLAFREARYLGSVLLEEGAELRQRLIDFTKKVLDLLPAPEAFPFHAEVFVQPNGELVFCEIACRAGGGRVVDMNAHAYGCHLLHQASLANCGLPHAGTPRLREYAGWLLIPPQEGELVALPPRPQGPWIVDYQVHAKAGERYDGARRSIDHYVSVVVSGKDPNEVQERIQAVAEWIETRTTWKRVRRS